MTGVAKHAMLESLLISSCKVVDLQFDLRNMERLGTLDFWFGDMKDVFVINASKLRSLSLEFCHKLEVLDLSNLPQLLELSLLACTAFKRLTSREPLVALRSVSVNGCWEPGVVLDLNNFPGLQELKLLGCETLTCTKPLHALRKMTLWDVKE